MLINFCHSLCQKEYERKTSELERLEEELSLLKAAVDLAFDDQHSIDFHIEQLQKKVHAKKHNLQELNSQWYDIDSVNAIYFHQNLALYVLGNDICK